MPGRIVRAVAVIAALVGLAFNLLFLVTGELPATVPIALTLLILEIAARRRSSAPADV